MPPVRFLITLVASCASLAASAPHLFNLPRTADAATSLVNQTTCDNKNFVYESLAGYGFVPSDARDRFGDTLGGYGSAIAIDRKSWRKTQTGSYTGLLWALPDRGW